MKKLMPLFVFVIAVAVIIASCEEDNPAGPAPYAPQFENQWHEENAADHTFQFNTDDDSLTRGIFTGAEDYPDSNFFDSHLAGFFINREIEFNVQRPSGTVKFKGSFVTDDKIELNSAVGSLILVR